MKKLYLCLSLLLCGMYIANAQNWQRDMHDPHVNFFTVQREFNQWWAANGKAILAQQAKGGKYAEREGAWKLYKRWEKQMLPMMTATSGVRLGAANTHQQLAPHGQRTGGGNWTYIGAPISFDDDGTGDSSTGRVNCVRFDPINRNIIYCGTPTGGLWKSTDFGQSWQLLNTDQLAQIGLSDIALNPQNPNTIYIATGDIANYQCQSIGVLKSTNGGATWNSTGLSFTIGQGIEIARLLMSPADSNTMLAATNIGIYKTTDGGATWVNVDSVTGFTGMEFNPANPQTVYACGTQLYKSVNGGSSWFKLSNGLPDSLSSGGFAIGVTPADTTCVYVLVSDTSNGQAYQPFKGIYRSLDAGNSFVLQNANPDPSNTGTQGYYDLTVGVSSLDKNVLVIGAVQCSYSTDGGVTWSNSNQNTSPHVDHHDIRYLPGSADTVFSADDGGLFISVDGGIDWRGRNNGMHIGEIYNVSSGTHSKYLTLTGRQDEGTLYQDTTFESIIFGGDGLECLVDPMNENNLYVSSENGYIGNISPTGNYNTIANNGGAGVNGNGAWNTPYLLMPGNSQSIIVGKDFVYKSTDGGSTWAPLSLPDLTSSYYYQYIVVAPSDTNVIYAAGYYKIYRSTNGGATYTDITGSLNGYISSLAVSPSNPNEIWVGFASSGGGSTAAIYRSVNGGNTYSAFDQGMPAGSGSIYSATTIAPVRNSPDALYAALSNAGGVYYRDSTMSNWLPFSNGLPNVTVDDLEVDYCSGTLRAATYGRDVWETTPYTPLTVPPTALAVDSVSPVQCPTATVTFTDTSTNYPTGWQWYFPGGQPASSTAKNPTVTYPAGHPYTVTFIASNAYGADTAYYHITTANCVGIDPIAQTSSISVYPNPSNGSFVIAVTGAARGTVAVTMHNSVGQQVYSNTYNKNAEQLNAACAVPGIAAGIYYLHITTADGATSTIKLVVE